MRVAPALACALLIAAAGCKSKSGSGGKDAGNDAGPSGTGGSSAAGKGGGGAGGSGAKCTSKGGPVAGDKDMHCTDSSGMEIKQVTNESACNVTTGGDDGGVEEDAPVLFNSEGDDDDCKYHLKWTVSCVEENKDVTFNVTITKKADGKPLTGAAPDLEVFLTDTHVAPNTKQAPKETSPGVYTAGPIRFDAPGKWTVRFHLRETCADVAPDSPHGHAAFFVDVP